MKKDMDKLSMTTQAYDIIIIGAGSGGLNVAGFFSRLKLRVLLIDKSDISVGGDCLNTGCIPSKALIHIAHQIQSGKEAERFLRSKNTFSIDMQEITKYIAEKQSEIRKNENPEYLKQKGIDYVSGHAVFTDEKTVLVEGVSYTAPQFILATGSRARTLSVPNDNSIREFTNESIFTIDFLPKEFVFIGGGPINCELGQAFSRLGAHVTILNSGERILEKECEEASALLKKTLEEEGVNVMESVVIQKIEGGKVFYTKDALPESFSLSADAVFVGIGRVLNIENLGLGEAKVETDASKSRLIVDEYLRTTNKRVCAVGDVAGNYQFTHAAELHAKLVIKNLLSPFKKKFDAKNMAWVTYTSPEIATFGVSKKTAEDLGYEILFKDCKHEDRAIVDETKKGFLMLYVDKKGCIQGGTLMREDAGEIAGELILAMTEKLPLQALFNKVYPYPTASRINKLVAGEYISRKLTEKSIKVLRTLYKYVSG